MQPEQVTAKILEKIKKAAQDHVGANQTVKKCIVTVPAYFNDQQRRSTEDACTLAGLECVKIINEPTAAALASGLHFTDMGGVEKKFMIFDFGGGTLDITILKVNDGVFQTLATSGDCNLGGQDVDNALVAHFFDKIEEEHGMDMRS